MKSKKVKALISTCLALSMAVVLSAPAFAGSASQTIGGYILTGSVSMSGRSATASSSFGTTAGVRVELEYTYEHGLDEEKKSVTKKAHDSAISYVSVMASADPNHTEDFINVRARATHFASYNGMTANFQTTA